LALNFFPSGNDTEKFLQSLSVFGSACLCRPIGGIFIADIGEKFGRKRALEVSILLMLVPSFLIGFIPNYNSIGIVSTSLLVLFRLIQGIAAGGGNLYF